MKGFLNYLRGLAIGVCALIPGISGGTMALLLGIYERLISAVGSFSPKNLLLGFKKKKSLREKKVFKTSVKKLDLGFILTIVAGILTMLFLGSTGLLRLLEAHYAYTISFFIGLIVASGFFIHKQIKDHDFKTMIFALFGFIIGISFLFLVPATLLNPPLLYVLFAGFIAVGALFLPGISGSLVLLLMGVYEFMLAVVSNPFDNWPGLVAFAVGLVVGAVIISKAITKLFNVAKSKTLYTLLGLVFGSLAIPIRNVLNSGIPLMWLAIVFFILGFGVVFLLENLGRK